MSKVSIKQISWNKEQMESRLEFNIKGINHTIINTFRRVILTSIPIYVFNKITISENTSIFNNNYMHNRIRNLPVFGISSDNPIFTKQINTDKKETEDMELDEKKIIQYAYDNIKMILDNFLQLIPEKNESSGKFQMNNADHTLGNLISEGLQNHKDIKFGGYNCPHLLDKKITFHYELNDSHKNNNIKNIITEIVDHYQKVFLKINKLIQEKIK